MKYLNFKTSMDYGKLKQVAKEIKKGKVAVFPTETVYGIGTNALDEKAVKKIYSIKNRPQNKPISLLVSNLKMIKDITQNITEIEEKIIANFFPGPLTIVLEKKSIVPDLVTSGGKTVGIRMPKNDVALKLIEYSGVPLATSSANISGKDNGVEIEDIINEFSDNVDYYIDTGHSKLSVPSTVIKVVNNEINILREGIITKNDILKIL